MRQIKFRGWCEKDSEWRFGFYVTDGENHEILTKLKSGEMYASCIREEDIDCTICSLAQLVFFAIEVSFQ